MENEMKRRFMEMIREEMGESHRLAPVIASLVGMVEDDEMFGELYEIHEGMEEYGQFLTEKEARKVVEGFVSYDGMRGAKWQPNVLFEAVERLGGHKAERGSHNCWALFALMNMMHSDYGGALSAHLQGDSYAKTCYLMSLAWMNDRDHANDVREYFLE